VEQTKSSTSIMTETIVAEVSLPQVSFVTEDCCHPFDIARYNPNLLRYALGDAPVCR
jgi:hypothetical protein